MPIMDSNITDLQSMVDKLSKELDKETKKRESAIRDKEQALEKLRLYTEIFESLKISEPEIFMANFEQMQTDLNTLSQELAEKTTLLAQKDERFKLKDEEVQAHKALIRQTLETATSWMTDNLSFDRLQQQPTQLGEDDCDLISQIYLPEK